MKSLDEPLGRDVAGQCGRRGGSARVLPGRCRGEGDLPGGIRSDFGGNGQHCCTSATSSAIEPITSTISRYVARIDYEDASMISVGARL